MDAFPFAISITIVALIYALIEVAITLLFGYRNKVFLAVIVAVNLFTVILYEVFLSTISDGLYVWQLALSLVLIITVELGILFVTMKKRYTVNELLILIPVMNLISFPLVFLIKEFI